MDKLIELTRDEIVFLFGYLDAQAEVIRGYRSIESLKSKVQQQIIEGQKSKEDGQQK